MAQRAVVNFLMENLVRLFCFSSGPWRNILFCFVALRATEKFIILGEIFNVVLRPEGPQRNF